LRRTRAKGALIAAVTLALVALGFVLGRTMLERRDTRAPTVDLGADVSQRIREFRRVKVEGGRTAWELTAREAEYFESEGRIVVDRPEVSFFGDDGESVQIKGREGRVFLQGTELEKIELGGGIEVRVAGYLLRTDQAVWVQDHDMVVSPGRVQVIGDQLEVDGEGMLVDIGRRRLQLRRGVTTTIRGSAAGPAADAPGDLPASGPVISRAAVAAEPPGEPHAAPE
jgi:LPS export ABC transporter protein LptC